MKYSTVTSLKALRELASSVKADSTKFMQALAIHKAEVAKRKESIAQALAQIDPTQRKISEAHYEALHSEWLKAFRKETAPVRAEMVQALASGAAAIRYAKDQLANPRYVATGYMLGSEERFRLESSLDKMGTGSLAALAEKAQAERNTPSGKLLAACVALANDQTPRASRTVDSIALCEAVFGAECKQVADLCKEVEREASVAQLLDGEFNGKPITATERMALGLTFGGDPLNHPSRESRKDSDVANGLEILNQLARDNKVEDEPFDVTWARILKEAAAA